MFIGRDHYHPNHAARSAGFTILELMVAASVFTVVLLVVAVGVLSYTNSYFKGINSSKTQAATRSVMDALVQSIQFGKSVTWPSGGSGGVAGICVDNTLYAYHIGQEVTDTSPQSGLHQGFHGLITVTGGDCSGPLPASIISTLSAPGTAQLAGARELLGRNMRLGDLTVMPNGNFYTIHVRILYGDDDLLTSTSNWANATCLGGRPGSQFCAVSDLTTTVERRLL